MKIIKESNKVYITEDNNDELLAYVSFPSTGENEVTIDHTVVSPSLRGQGIGSILLENAYEVIRNQNLKAIPTCSYAIKWFSKNPDKTDILKNK